MSNMVLAKRPTVAWVAVLNNGEKITGGPSWLSINGLRAPNTGQTDWQRLMARCKDDARLRIDVLAVGINGMWAEAPRLRSAYGYMETYQSSQASQFRGTTSTSLRLSPRLVSVGLCYVNDDERGQHIKIERYLIDQLTGNAIELEFIRHVRWQPCMIGTKDDEFDRGKITELIAPSGRA